MLDTLLVFYAALVSRDPTDLLDLAARSDFASTLHHMLASIEHSNDPLWLVSAEAGAGELKAAGISKAEVILVSMFPIRDICILPICEVRQYSEARAEEVWSL